MTTSLTDFLSSLYSVTSASANGASLVWMHVLSSSRDIKCIVCIQIRGKKLAYIHEDSDGTCFVSLSWNISYSPVDEIEQFGDTDKTSSRDEPMRMMRFFKMDMSELLCEDNMIVLQRIFDWALRETTYENYVLIRSLFPQKTSANSEGQVETLPSSDSEKSMGGGAVEPVLCVEAKKCEKGHKNCVKCPNFDKCGRCFTRDGQEHKKHDFNILECQNKLKGKPKKAK